MSVIITTPNSYDTIRALVQALRLQTARDALEVVIVAPSVAAIRSGLADLQDFRCWRIVELGDLRSSGQAKTAGIRCATASVVVLTEDHCFPDPGWARALIEAHRGNWAAVGPATAAVGLTDLRDVVLAPLLRPRVRADRTFERDGPRPTHTV